MQSSSGSLSILYTFVRTRPMMAVINKIALANPRFCFNLQPSQLECALTKYGHVIRVMPVRINVVFLCSQFPIQSSFGHNLCKAYRRIIVDDELCQVRRNSD